MSGVLFSIAAGPVATITNFYAGGGVQSATSLASNATNNLKEMLSGALVAATLKSLVLRAGRGRVNGLTIYVKDTTSRTIRLQLIVDGQVTPAFDATSSAITVTGMGMVVLGSQDGAAASSQVWQPIDYNASLEIKIASSLSETDKIAIGINEETWQ